MCGIFCAVSCHQPIRPSPELQQLLEQRGPDASGSHAVSVSNSSRDISTRVSFFSTVLSLRGEVTIQQPYQAETSRSVLCWNGEAWAINGMPPASNDTEAVFRLLEKATQTPFQYTDRREGSIQRAAIMVKRISKGMAQLAGPYAFVFYDDVNSLVYFGRDFLGRRSLLTKLTEAGDLLISSVADASATDGWSEVEADGLYCVDLFQVLDHSSDGPNTAAPYSRHPITKVPYHHVEVASHAPIGPVIPRLSLNKQLPSAATLLNSMAPSVLRLEEMLLASLTPRILNIPEPPGAHLSDAGVCAPRLAILFSGGLDCTVLARLAHDILPLSEGIDLLNVAFENPRIHKAADKGTDSQAVYELCPDRVTGRASYAELQDVCPNRDWRFVAINTPYTETMEHRQRVIKLMHPHNTEMDLSISYALYFAARGVGYISPSSSMLEPYTPCARVLLSGLGADELFGGYQRHATAYGRNGFSGLLEELDLDIGRLGKRNLGRDDRVISNWGREARFPYLDEQLLAWALDAPVMDKCGFGEQASDDTGLALDGSETLEPGKKVLRCLAWKLWMRDVAKEKKRAIQFGARTAKMETGKTKGTQLLSQSTGS